MIQYEQYSLCSIIILICLLYSTFFRRMHKGTTGRLFVILLVVNLLTASCDFATILCHNYAIRVSGNTSEFLNTMRYILHYMYLAARNFTAPAYVLYVVGLTDTWHLMTKNKLYKTIAIAPYACVIALLIINLLTGKLFHFSTGGAYTRGPLFPILYICATAYLIAGFFYLKRYKALFTRDKLIALYSIFPITAASVLIQWIMPDLQIEMFAASLSMLMLTMVVQRPEEIIHSITGTKRFEAYTSDVKLAYTNKKHINVIMVNPSNYTSIQKVIGYDAANRLLRCVAERIDKTCKTCKVDADIYYLDRGRFRIVLSHNNKKKTEELAEQINTALKGEFDLNEFDLSLRAYVCVVRLPEEISNFRELMRFGSTVHETTPFSGNVLYASDILNKSRVAYSDELDNIIEKAIVNKNFKVYYQPIYSVAEERFTTAEALLRLIDDEYGFIPPDVFITAAEKSGAIHRIGDYVLEEVCRFISSDEFKKLGLDYIEINLSVAQCMQKDLCDKVLDIVKKYNVSTSQINLEITETAANYAQDVLTENLKKLTEAGISLSLDDYGTGYSNIKRVASLPLTIVKLDKTFVNEVDDPRMWIVLKNTIKMLKEMDIQIVVEGIETEKLKDKFSALKCEFIQGYYFSRPLPEQDFSNFILNA